MRYYLTFIMFLLLLASCKKEIKKEMWIVISNGMDSSIQVNLFPKSQFVHGDLYKFSSVGSGYLEKNFPLFEDLNKTLYYSDNMNNTPQNLLAQIFDSITIIVHLDSIIVVKFKPNQSVNYSTNMYSQNANWVFRQFNFDSNTQTSNPVLVDEYTFEISKNGIIKKKDYCTQ